MSRYAEISTFSKTCIFFLLCFLTTHLCLAHHSSLLYAFTPGQHRLVVFWSSYIFLHYFLKRNPCLAAQGSSLGTTLLMSIRLSKMQKYPMSNLLAFGLVNVHFDDLYQSQLVHANAPRRNLSELYGILSTFILGSLCRLSAAFTRISSKTLYKAGT